MIQVEVLQYIDSAPVYVVHGCSAHHRVGHVIGRGSRCGIVVSWQSFRYLFGTRLELDLGADWRNDTFVISLQCGGFMLFERIEKNKASYTFF